ncbi:MAG: DNA replication/repair protein RecF [Chloroflexota bacterium]|nr:DNA replication/repair protein RecF [Chloroflexota bacterium]
MSLSNFRNYTSLELDLPPGPTIVKGSNGHGKSNLLEAMYALAIAKSSRAALERDLVNKASLENLIDGFSYAMVGGTVLSKESRERLEIHYRSQPSENDDGFTTQKFIRINGIPKRASDLVGRLNAVLFSVEDLDLVFGRPSTRRRYLDILLSQMDSKYLRTLQQYQRAITQRNHLLRSIREGLSVPSELDFWDDQISNTGSTITTERVKAVRSLSETSRPLHSDISGTNENMCCEYLSSSDIQSEEEPSLIEKSLASAIWDARNKDIAQGSTSVGPHRDDMKILIEETSADRFASRGQARTAILALKFAEANFLKGKRGSEPVLLLDDLLSELDMVRRDKVIRHTAEYEQCIVTAAEINSVPGTFLRGANELEVIENTIRPSS